MSLIKAYVWRAMLDVRPVFFSYVSIFLGVYVLTLSVITYFPNVLTSISKSAIEQLAQRYFGPIPQNSAPITLIFIAIWSPYLCAIFSSIIASSVPTNLVTLERERGGFEILLAAPIKMRQIVIALLATSVLAALATCVLLVGITAGLSLVILQALHTPIQLRILYIELSLILPVSVTLLSVTLASLLSLSVPRISSLSTGLLPTQNMAVTISILPGLIAFLILNLSPSSDPLVVASYVSAISALAGGLLIAVFPSVVKREMLIA